MLTDRLGNEAVPVLVHQSKQPLCSALFSHELLKGEAAALGGHMVSYKHSSLAEW